MKRSLRIKSIFIGLYSSLFFLLLYLTNHHQTLADLGINVFSIGACLITLVWMIKTFKTSS
ncbi:hypothetical protein V7266_14635 [Neobacillus drentensis]|uniref:hypothetical protein n=1 Tax=Neobacillus drentensis TaxID=220684 RepID=UPI002FFF86C4